jgi:hypothetical protein
VCGDPAEPSAVGTPTCSAVCTGVLADRVLPKVADALVTRADGSGGTPSAITPERPRFRRLPVRREGRASVEVALERLGSPIAVLERHGRAVRGRMAFCVWHPNTRTPAMAAYQDGAFCFSCGGRGDAIDLEAALAGESITDVIRRWGR